MYSSVQVRISVDDSLVSCPLERELIEALDVYLAEGRVVFFHCPRPVYVR